MHESSANVLIAPLDWGLGHATRCIPVIESLLNRGCKVVIAGSGYSGDLLRNRFPELVFKKLPSYNITYPRKGNMALHLLKQLPRLFGVIRSERQILEKIIARHQITHVISDNRYGMHSNGVECIFMTHQIRVSSGTSQRWMDQFIFKLHKRFIEKFNRVWIVDEPGDGEGKWAGKLSNPDRLGIPYQFVGLLSRFTRKDSNSISTEAPYERIALISGPEPQRTLLEEKLMRHFAVLPGRSLLIRGMAGDERREEKNTTVVNGIDDSTLRKFIANTPVVYCRSGYSTLMDLLHLQHSRAVLIPTPGQTEQAYLGDRFARMFGFTCAAQNEELPKVPTSANHLPQTMNNRNFLEEAIDHLLTKS